MGIPKKVPIFVVKFNINKKKKDMKKIILIMMSVIALVSCDNSAKIEKDVDTAFETLQVYGKECGDKYYQKTQLRCQSGKSYSDEELVRLKKNIENEANETIAMIFEPLFEKYDVDETLVFINQHIVKEDPSMVPYSDKISFMHEASNGIMVYVLNKVAKAMEEYYTENLCKR